MSCVVRNASGGLEGESDGETRNDLTKYKRSQSQSCLASSVNTTSPLVSAIPASSELRRCMEV